MIGELMRVETKLEPGLNKFTPNTFCWLTDTADKNMVGYVTNEYIADRMAVLLSMVGSVEIGTLEHVGYEYVWYIKMTDYGPWKNMEKARGFFCGYCWGENDRK